jgi:hypothetical protein
MPRGLETNVVNDNPDVGWYVHFGRLAEATEGAGETAGGLRRKTAELGPQCVAAVADHGGMASATALSACHARFADHLHGHAAELSGIGEQLASNHRHYSNAEQSSDRATTDVREV